MDALTRPKNTSEPPPTPLAVPLLARATVGALAGAILGKVASAIVGYLLYLVMILSVLNRPAGIDSWFMGMTALPLLGWSFGAPSRRPLRSRDPRESKAHSDLCRMSCLAGLRHPRGQQSEPHLGGFIAVITFFGAVATGLSIYLAAWLLVMSQTRRRKAA
ncbi:MAG TPA: hypothetical protein VJ574_03430 [Candidatus Bathyarchaeia archaeon]|nr:hypothetical protein [Candidatus Bathyarchaeia archaeon]